MIINIYSYFSYNIREGSKKAYKLLKGSYLEGLKFVLYIILIIYVYKDLLKSSILYYYVY